MHTKFGSLAQLVQSICLTSRGSGVRTPQLPQEMPHRNVGHFLFIMIWVRSLFRLFGVYADVYFQVKNLGAERDNNFFVDFRFRKVVVKDKEYSLCLLDEFTVLKNKILFGKCTVSKKIIKLAIQLN